MVGEGEITFPEILNDTESLPKVIRGKKPDLNAIPWVDRQLFDYKRELSCCFSPGQNLPSITMLAGRGCPYKCSYCQPAENSVFGKPYRLRSPMDVCHELLCLYDQHCFESITFWDDTFTVNPKWVDEFCRLYSQTGIKAKIAACSRADIICKNESMVERMASIGVDCLVIGVESGCQRLLDFIKKGTTVEQNIESAKICKKHGIKVFATHMYGLPTETREDSLATFRMIQEINPEFPSPFIFLPIEGTDIYNYCQENDLILSNVKDRTIARTGMFVPTIKNVDYDYIYSLIFPQQNEVSG